MNLNETYVKIPKSNNNKKILQKLHLKMWFLQIQTTGYRKPSQTVYRLWPLYYLCQLLWKTFHCNDGRITECNFSDICNSTTEYIYMCVCVCVYVLINKSIVWSVFELNTLRDRDKMAATLAGDIFKCRFVNENVFTSIQISLNFVPKGPIDSFHRCGCPYRLIANQQEFMTTVQDVTCFWT